MLKLLHIYFQQHREDHSQCVYFSLLMKKPIDLFSLFVSCSYKSACDTEEINKARAGVSTGPLFFPSVHKGVPWQSHPMLAHTVTRASGSIDRSLLPDY